MPDVPCGRLHNSSSARDIGRSFVGAEGFETSRREPNKIEMRFAHLSASSSSAGFDCVVHERLDRIDHNMSRLERDVSIASWPSPISIPMCGNALPSIR
jgi:hypothetical protein